MGTRNLTCVVENNLFKYVKYGQWDGYPESLGINIAKFIENKFNKKEFRDHLKDLTIISEKEIRNEWERLRQDFQKKYPHIGRDMSGDEALKSLQKGFFKEIPDPLHEIKFAGDSLFCEWLYVLDLSKDRLEIYKGFNLIKLTPKDRFYFLQEKDQEYKPVKLVKWFKLDSLISKKMDKWMREFFKESE